MEDIVFGKKSEPFIFRGVKVPYGLRGLGAGQKFLLRLCRKFAPKKYAAILTSWAKDFNVDPDLLVDLVTAILDFDLDF